MTLLPGSATAPGAARGHPPRESPRVPWVSSGQQGPRSSSRSVRTGPGLGLAWAEGGEVEAVGGGGTGRSVLEGPGLGPPPEVVQGRVEMRSRRKAGLHRSDGSTLGGWLRPRCRGAGTHIPSCPVPSSASRGGTSPPPRVAPALDCPGWGGFGLLSCPPAFPETEHRHCFCLVSGLGGERRCLSSHTRGSAGFRGVEPFRTWRQPALSLEF